MRLERIILTSCILTFNESFQIVFWVPFAARAWPDVITERMPAYMNNTGASLWFRRKDAVYSTPVAVLAVLV